MSETAISPAVLTPTASCCFYFPLPNPLRIFTWIFERIFGKAEEGFSAVDLDKLKKKDIKPLSEPQALKQPVKELIGRVLQAIQSNQDSWIGEALNELFTYFQQGTQEEEQLVNFATDLTSSTILNLLLNKTEKTGDGYLQRIFALFTNNNSEDQQLLNAIMGHLIPTTTPNTAYLLLTTPYIDRLPENLQTFVRSRENVDVDQLARHTLFFNVEEIKKLLGDEKGREYLKEVLQIFLKPKFEAILRDPQNSDKVLQLLKNMEPSVNSGLANLIKSISPLIIDRFIESYKNLYSPGNEVADDLLSSLSKHLDILIASHREAGPPHLGLNLETLEDKIVGYLQLNLEEKTVVRSIWGDEPPAGKDILNNKRREFLDSCPNPQSAAEFIKKKGNLNTVQPAKEISETIYSLIDQFFDDTFITNLIKEASKHQTLEQYFGKIDSSALKNLIPLLKTILKIYLSNQMLRDDGWFEQIRKYLSVSEMDRLLVHTVMPSIKDAMLKSLLNQVLLNNPSLITDQPKTEDIFLKCKDAYPSIDNSFKDVIRQYVEGFEAYKTERPQPENTKQKRQIVEAFLESDTGTDYQNTAVISALTKQVLFDLSGLPGWLKWIMGMFSSMIDHQVASAIHPYRKESGRLTQILIDQIEKNLGTQEQVNRLFSKVDPASAPKIPISLDESVDDIAKLVFATATYQGSFWNRMMMRIALGNNGSRVSTSIKNIFNKSVLQGADINQFLILDIVRAFANKFKCSSTEAVQDPPVAATGPGEFWEALV